MSVPADQMFQQTPPQSGVFVGQPEAMPPEMMERAESLSKLVRFSQSENIAEDLTEAQLKTIGQRCLQEYEADKSTRADWEKTCEEGLKLAKQVTEEKNWPWEGAANVKFPLLSEAAISFSARAYPELVSGEVVKAEVVGNDPQGLKAARATRVSKYQTWQLRYQMPYWDDDTDKLLVMLPLVGNVFRKVYKDPQKGAQARLVRAQDFVVNHLAKSMEHLRRETEMMVFYGNEAETKFRTGEWKRVELTSDRKEGVPDADKPYSILEQHRWLDLDEDGFEEPYIVTLQETSGSVLRIVARFTPDDVTINQAGEVADITAERFYTQYSFIPNPDGGLYAVGFCNLLYPIAESINTVLNQLLDAGTLSNTQGGLIAKGIRIKGGQMSIAPGEWKFVDSSGATLKDAVLFQLLGLLIESGKSLANLKDVLAGNMPNANVPATTVLAMIEQGQKVYSGIYKRIYRAMGLEFKSVFKINAKSAQTDRSFLQQYATVLDDPQASPEDFNTQDYDVCPVADPSVSSQTQRLARAQVLMPIAQVPGMKQDEIITEYLSAAGYSNPERFYDPKAAQAQQMQAMQQQAREREAAMMAGVAEMSAKLAKADAEIVKLKTESIKNIADAEAKEAGAQVAMYDAERQLLEQQTRAEVAPKQEAASGPAGNPTVQGGMGGMAGAPGQPVVPPSGI
jgi:chaperonin GroES